MAVANQITFEPLPIRRRTLVPMDGSQYTIMAGPGETKQIKADTAYEAFKLSGFAQAIKIERISSLAQPVLGKEQFTDASPSAGGSGATPESNEAFPQASRQKKLIVSADELDALMHTLQETAARAQLANLASASAAPAVTQETVPGPTGMDVRGEGFDEIIPSSPAAKPTIASKPAEPKETVKTESQIIAGVTPSSAPLPEHELSKEEVDKLLGGK